MKIAIRSWLPLYDSNATRIFTLIIFCALVLRVGWVIYAQTVPGSDFYQYDLLAQRLANGQGYVDEFGEPTAFYAIGWPFSLSVIYRIFGYSLIVPQLINALLSVGSVLLTYKLSIFVLNSRSALIAAGLMAINPAMILYSSTHGTESLFTFQALLITWLILRFFNQNQANKYLIIIGIFTGLAILVRPVAICVPIGAFGAFYISNRNDFRNNLVKVLIVLGVSAITISPWILRNALVVGSPTLQTSSGVVLWISHNPQATGAFMDPPQAPGLPRGAGTMPGAGPDANEAEANHVYTSAAINSIIEKPIRLITLVPNKMFELWAGHRHAVNHSTRKVGRSIPEFVILILPKLTQLYLMGLLFLVAISYVFKRSRVLWIGGLGITLTGIILAWNFYHAINFGSGRYHVPIEPLLAVIAASGFYALWHLIFSIEMRPWKFGRIRQ